MVLKNEWMDIKFFAHVFVENRYDVNEIFKLPRLIFKSRPNVDVFK